MGKEKIEIRNENGIHFAYFRGVKLPALIRTTITQGIDEITVGVLEFEVNLEKPSVTFEIKGSDLVSVINNQNNIDAK